MQYCLDIIIIRSDHPNNSKRGGVSMCYKESLGIKMIDAAYISDCILCVKSQ